MTTERLFRSGVLTAVVAIAATMLVAAIASANPYDVWPPDKCVFEQMIPYNESIDPYSVQLMTDMQKLIGAKNSTRIALATWTNANYHINGTNYQLEDVYLSNAWQVVGYWMRDVPFPTDQTVRVATGDTDQNLSFTDTIHGIEFSMWRPVADNNGVVVRNGSGYYEAENGHFVFTNTSGSGPGTGPRGCGIAHSVGLMFPEELQAGAIGHALAYAIVDPAWDPCPPATKSDGNDFSRVQYPVRLPEGAVFRLKPSIWTDAVIDSQSGSGWSLAEKAMARAARDYGIYVIDHTGCNHFYTNNLRAYPGAVECNEYDPYQTIDGLDCSHRGATPTYAWIWPPGFVGPTNFEVPDRIFFPFPQGDQWLDYDGDGIPNVAEVAFGYRNNTFYDEVNDPSNGPLDWDNDGLTNAQEIQLRRYFRYLPLNPLDADSDGDGYSDYEEANNWSADPTNPWVVPNPSWPGMPTGTNLALGKATSGVNFTNTAYAVDGDESTGATAGADKTGSITVDLGASKTINRVVIKWLGHGQTYATGYTIKVSPDNSSWTTVYTETEGNGGLDDCWGLTANGRYVKLDITVLGSPWGLLVSELEVYGAGAPQPPVANFSGNPTSGTAPLTVAFTDLSTNSPTSWSWNFGDGGTSTAQNPSHIYTSVGSKTVSLTATNAQGSDNETKTNYITVTAGQPPVAQFVGNPTSGTVPLTVNFTDQSTNNPTSWSWNFGDSGTSTAQNPSHQYTSTGQFTVTLTATNAYGSDPEVKTNYITVSAGGQPPVAQFVGNPTSGTVPLTVNFTDQSTNTPTSWSWNFGDSGTSTAQNPSHQYTSTGQFTVSLTATNAYGSDPEVKTNYITVSSGGGGDYTAASYTILTGTYVSGTLADTYTSNDAYLVVHTVALTGQQSTDIQWNFNTGLSSLSSLSVTQEWRAQGITGQLRQRTRLYNFGSGGWVEVDNRMVTVSSDTTVVVNITNPAPYISGTGEVRAKILCGDNGKTAFDNYIDLVKITAAP